MKKIYFLFSCISFALTVKAQLVLTGTNYTQNFDNIGTALPSEWACYKSATSSSLGTLDTYSGSPAFGAYYDTTNCAADVFGHGFKNCASATASSSTSSCTAQQAIQNRALGVRQVSGTSYPGYDPGAAFVLHIANTTGKSGFSLTFKLQSLDILSSRTTTWVVDYGIGSSPSSFTATSPTGTMVTGNSIFSNNTITVNFGTALDNQNQDVWIRVVALANTTGSGNRTTSAIDDFSLSYSNSTSSVESFSSPKMNFNVFGEAKSDKIVFGCTVEKSGAYNIIIYDMTGRAIYSKQVELITDSQNDITVNDLNLVSGLYIARLGNGNELATTKLIVE